LNFLCGKFTSLCHSAFRHCERMRGNPFECLCHSRFAICGGNLFLDSTTNQTIEKPDQIAIDWFAFKERLDCIM